MLHTDLLAERLSPAYLVVFLAEVKTDGKGLLVGEVGGHVAGVHARGQEAAYLDIGDLVGVDGVFKYLFDLVYRFLLRHVLVGLEARLKVTGYLDVVVFVPEIVTRHKAVYALEEGLGRQRVLERQVGVQRAGVEALFKLGVLQNTLDLACVDEVVAYHGVVHRLYSEEIAGDE